ncbi:MAG: methyltransferase domain-containing protein [Actinomycetota bacterium]|nr:methyltransferase domain-containing protein [Actinomycetota bacterium]
MPVHDAAAVGFDRGAADYEKGRPGFAPEVFALLGRELGIGPGRRVCDLAAGTGKFTRGLVELGADVVAIEPVAGMRREFTAALPTVELLDGTAEAIPLATASVDAVTGAQAFHWFDMPVALVEIRRVLRPGGGMAMVWNRRDHSVPWVAAMSEILLWHEQPYNAVEATDWGALVAAAGGFTSVEHATQPFVHAMTRDLLAARVRSMSYISAMAVQERERMVSAVVALTTEFDEPFPLPYICHIYWCHRV